MVFNINALALPTLSKGSKGSTVTAWQRFLLDKDYPIGAVDGDFGSVADAATRDFQTKNGLSLSGTVDAATYEKALEQGFAPYFAVYTDSGGAKLLAYLNFGKNEVEDLQQSLTAIAPLSPPLDNDGDFGPNSTRGLAETYKKLNTSFRAKLSTQLTSATKTKLATDFDTALDILTDYAKRLRQRLSGKEWLKFFPNSNSIDDLASPFRQKVQVFEKALQDAGATISVTSTLRPPERAYLMHYSFLINENDIKAENIPPMPNVDISWQHYTDAASKQAAKDMVDAYNIAFQPVLNSRHTQGLAIDWQITWSGTLNIKNASGTTVSVGSPRSSFSNSVLWEVGKTYGVIKLISDNPHWSSDGH